MRQGLIALITLLTTSPLTMAQRAARVRPAPDARLIADAATSASSSFRAGSVCTSMDGGFAEYIGSCLDITDSKLAAEEVRRLNEELERRVTERTA